MGKGVAGLEGHVWLGIERAEALGKSLVESLEKRVVRQLLALCSKEKTPAVETSTKKVPKKVAALLVIRVKLLSQASLRS